MEKGKKEKKEQPNELQAEMAELEDLLKRTQADFVNYRRRNEEDKINFAKFATADLMEQILPVMDNFRLAAKHVPEELTGNNWVVGVQSIEKQLEQILGANGLEKIETEGREFDPNLHEAIAQSKDDSKPNHIVLTEEAPGYMLNGKLLRPAKVIVNNK
jgi:molecular chaperone GrpE